MREIAINLLSKSRLEPPGGLCLVHKRVNILALAILFLLIFATFAWSSIEDDWDIQISDKIKIKVKGHAAQNYYHDFTENWIFNADGTCNLGNIRCTCT